MSGTFIARTVATTLGVFATAGGLAAPSDAATGGIWSTRAAGAERVGASVVSGGSIYELYVTRLMFGVRSRAVRGSASSTWQAQIPQTVDPSTGFTLQPNGIYADKSGQTLFPEVDALNVTATGAVISSRWCPAEHSAFDACFGSSVTRYEANTGKLLGGPEPGALAGTDTPTPVVYGATSDAPTTQRLTEPFGGAAFAWPGVQSDTNASIAAVRGRYVMVATGSPGAPPSTYSVFEYRTGKRLYAVTTKSLSRAAGGVSDIAPLLTRTGQSGVGYTALAGSQNRALIIARQGKIRRVSGVLRGARIVETHPAANRTLVTVSSRSRRSRCDVITLVDNTGQAGHAFRDERSKLKLSTTSPYTVAFFDGNIGVIDYSRGERHDRVLFRTDLSTLKLARADRLECPSR